MRAGAGAVLQAPRCSHPLPPCSRRATRLTACYKGAPLQKDGPESAASARAARAVQFTGFTQFVDDRYNWYPYKLSNYKSFRFPGKAQGEPQPFLCDQSQQREHGPALLAGPARGQGAAGRGCLFSRGHALAALLLRHGKPAAATCTSCSPFCSQEFDREKAKLTAERDARQVAAQVRPARGDGAVSASPALLSIGSTAAHLLLGGSTAAQLLSCGGLRPSPPAPSQLEASSKSPPPTVTAAATAAIPLAPPPRVRWMLLLPARACLVPVPHVEAHGGLPAPRA